MGFTFTCGMTKGCKRRRYSLSFCFDVRTKLISYSPKAKAVGYMALAMAVHFAGYEFARSATMSLLTSKETGFHSPAVLPLGVGCVCPFSILLLFSFTRVLKRHGPRCALFQSTLICTLVLAIAAIVLFQINGRQIVWGRDVSKILLFFLFIFQSAYVQFLYTQHMSFIGSVLNPEEGKVWFAPIAGLGSIMSTLSAGNISSFVEKVGLIGLLFSASITIGLSGILGDIAYRIAAKNEFEPKHETKESDNSEKDSQRSTTAKDALMLLRRVPPLGALFCDMIAAQAFSSLLNFLFLLKAKNIIFDDSARAGFTGKRYAWINGISGVLQFFIIPIVTKIVDVRWLWLFMPVTMLCLSCMQLFEAIDSINVVSFSFAMMKIMEYSLRGVTSEILYVSLDYDSRFIGKEVINLFASRLGKSSMAVCLSVLSSFWVKGDSELEQFLSFGLSVVAVSWIFTTLRLTRLLPTENAILVTQK